MGGNKNNPKHNYVIDYVIQQREMQDTTCRMENSEQAQDGEKLARQNPVVRADQICKQVEK